MPTQSSNLTPIPLAPIREYARTAVDALKFDQRHGVLAWRIADYLLSQARSRADLDALTLADAPQSERAEFLRQAHTVIALGESIDGQAPPTPAEIARYELHKDQALARARARNEARRHGHTLAIFRPSNPGYELALCSGCGAGISLHLETAGLSASRQLELPCDSTRSTR